MAKVAELTPDLILLDVMMPGVNGFEVCRRLRADPLLAEVPIIMVTALDDRDSRLQGIEAGADDFVTKPFDQIELRARVQTITRLNHYRQRLRESERMASLGRLIAGAAHELNNPVGAIRSVQETARRALAKINDSLDISPAIDDSRADIKKKLAIIEQANQTIGEKQSRYFDLFLRIVYLNYFHSTILSQNLDP